MPLVGTDINKILLSKAKVNETNYLIVESIECWKAYNKGQLVYEKKKTFTNTYKEYGFVDEVVKIDVPDRPNVGIFIHYIKRPDGIDDRVVLPSPDNVSDAPFEKYYNSATTGPDGKTYDILYEMISFAKFKESNNNMCPDCTSQINKFVGNMPIKNSSVIQGVNVYSKRFANLNIEGTFYFNVANADSIFSYEFENSNIHSFRLMNVDNIKNAAYMFANAVIEQLVFSGGVNTFFKCDNYTGMFLNANVQKNAIEIDYSHRTNPYTESPNSAINLITDFCKGCSVDIIPADRDSEDANTIICPTRCGEAFNGPNLTSIEPILDFRYVRASSNLFSLTGSLTDIKLKNLNHNDWDFSGKEGSNGNFENITQLSLDYLMDSLTDLQARDSEGYVNDDIYSIPTTNIAYLRLPEKLRGMVSDERKTAAAAKGWRLLYGDETFSDGWVKPNTVPDGIYICRSNCDVMTIDEYISRGYAADYWFGYVIKIGGINFAIHKFWYNRYGQNNNYLIYHYYDWPFVIADKTSTWYNSLTNPVYENEINTSAVNNNQVIIDLLNRINSNINNSHDTSAAIYRDMLAKSVVRYARNRGLNIPSEFRVNGCNYGIIPNMFHLKALRYYYDDIVNATKNIIGIDLPDNKRTTEFWTIQYDSAVADGSYIKPKFYSATLDNLATNINFANTNLPYFEIYPLNI